MDRTTWKIMKALMHRVYTDFAGIFLGYYSSVLAFSQNGLKYT